MYVSKWKRNIIESKKVSIFFGSCCTSIKIKKKPGTNILYKLAKSKNLWEKRIAIVSTYTFIKNKKFNDTFKIAEILMNDKHDLIHKAGIWNNI